MLEALLLPLPRTTVLTEMGVMVRALPPTFKVVTGVMVTPD